MQKYNIPDTFLEQRDMVNNITCKDLVWLIIIASAFHDWVYWHVFIITVNYNSSYIELLLDNVCLTNDLLRISHCSVSSDCTRFYNCEWTSRESTTSKGSFPYALPRKLCVNSQATIWISKCLQLSESLSAEKVFRNQLVSREQSLRGIVFSHSFPRNGSEMCEATQREMSNVN
jgi:hypothetical protein